MKIKLQEENVSKLHPLISVFSIVFFMVMLVSAETVVLNAVSGTGGGPVGWDAGGETLGDDASAPDGTASTYIGKVPNRRFFVPIEDTTMTATDTIYSVKVRVLAKADTNMSGTYDGIRIAIRTGGTEFRIRSIHELDTVYTYCSNTWATNPATGLDWTWDDINSLEAGVFTAKTRQLTYATFYVDHIQIVVTYGNGNSPPFATSVSLNGTLEVGQTLTGSYVYGDNEENPEGASLFQWYRAESANPNDTLKAAISTALGQDYILRVLEEGKYVSFEVTPVASSGVLEGIPVESEMVGPVLPKPGDAPSATDVAIEGLPYLGETLNGTYTYSDADGDLEGETSFRWLRDGSPINGATDMTYKLSGNDMETAITFEVTPVALTGLPKTGSPVVSEETYPTTGSTGTVNRPALLDKSAEAEVLIVDVKGRTVKSLGRKDISKGAYIMKINTPSGMQFKRVSKIK